MEWNGRTRTDTAEIMQMNLITLVITSLKASKTEKSHLSNNYNIAEVLRNNMTVKIIGQVNGFARAAQ